MKNLVTGVILVCIIIISSCKKSGDNASKDIALIQHKWMVVYVHGEALRYNGTAEDYYNFAVNNILYTSVNERNDTIAYTLLSDNHTLLFYPIVNGVKSSSATNFNINSISANQLTISNSSNNPPVNVEISLSR
jgi:hypothetical protein